MALKSFTVHAAPGQAGRDPDSALRFVPDTFSLIAFIAPWAYFLWHRMWLVTFAYLLAVGVVILGLGAAGLTGPVVAAIGFVFNLVIGLEATNLRRWTLDRSGFREQAVVVAASRDEAERRYFAEREAALAPPPPPAGPPSAYPAAASPQHVIGLFPEAEGGARSPR
ncbi:DUF2628 domain-containing protein [Phreatobacter sp. AB_2022a]|uniref:DUF2628 domain-containing protein n=1 Tax=Phreatobacter sp. AB_2022a TaxID=3003134 RepID=UPI0022873F17|nr:DUF2628 domain-containing protein [Phreatobacter sp. AB_2022a]MCZ0736020.1 DUF2628 domain-containing protein [Phreatobacter sp. AB_2022a]